MGLVLVTTETVNVTAVGQTRANRDPHAVSTILTVKTAAGIGVATTVAQQALCLVFAVIVMNALLFRTVIRSAGDINRSMAARAQDASMGQGVIVAIHVTNVLLALVGRSSMHLAGVKNQAAGIVMCATLFLETQVSGIVSLAVQWLATFARHRIITHVIAERF